jgi:predicted permease
MLHDLRLALRRLGSTPAFSLSAILILGAGVGAVAAMASVLDALAYQKVSIPEPETLVTVFTVDKEGVRRNTPLPAIDRLHAAQLAASGWCAYNTTLDALESGGRVVESYGEVLSGDCLSVLRLTPLMGRWFTPEEAPLTGSARPVTIITHSLWQRLFDGAPDVIGRTVKIQNISATVIAVMPESYRGFSQDLHAEYILPFNAHRESSGGVLFVGRLQPGRSIDELRTQVRGMWPSLLEAVLPASPTRAQSVADWSSNAELIPYGQSTLRRLYTPTVTRMTWLAAALFALVCLNIGGLMVSRVAGRSVEIATMRALGAKPFRIVRQLAAECAIVAVAATAIGVPIAYVAANAFTNLMPIGNLRWDIVTRPNASVLAFIVISCVVIAIVMAALPAAMSGRRATQLRTDRTVSRSTSRWAQGLLVMQIAATVVLVFAAGVLFKSFSNLRHADRGYVKERLLSLRLSANPAGYQNFDPLAYYPALIEKIKGLPGVESVGLARYFGTLNGRPFNQPVGFAGTSDTVTTGMTEFVSPGFFATAGVPLLRGRDVAWTDKPDTPAVAVISESLARALAPDGDVLGRVIRHGTLPATSRLQVIGVVGNVSFGNFRINDVRAIYLPAIQARETAFATVHLRTQGQPMSLASAATEAIGSLGREHVRSVHAEDVLFTNSIVAERMGVIVSSGAAALALVISCIGLFALMSNTVHKRTREIGIRLAVGASPAAVSTLIIGDAVRLALIGVILGLPMAVGSASFISTLLYGVTTADAATLAVSASVLLAAAAIGAAEPAVRAVRVDPATALRAE